MARFTATRDVAAPAPAVWDALVDWTNHGRWVPLTRVVIHTPSGLGTGARFTGRTGLGPLGFDDPMEVVAWDPPAADGTSPGRCEVVKQGRVVLGRAWFTVTPQTVGGAPGSRVVWDEDVEIAPVRLTRVLGPVVALVGRLGFSAMLGAMAREVEARQAQGRRG